MTVNWLMAGVTVALAVLILWFVVHVARKGMRDLRG